MAPILDSLDPIQFLQKCVQAKGKAFAFYMGNTGFLNLKSRAQGLRSSNMLEDLDLMPRVKPSSYNLRKETCFKPKINTMRFKNSFINRLVFKYELAL